MESRLAGDRSSLNPAKLIFEMYTGTDPAAAMAAEQELLSFGVKTPFKLGRVPVDMSHIGLGTQHIATLELNPDAPGPAIVWAHGAGAGLGFGYRNYDTLAQLGGKRRRVLAFDWLGQANSTRPAFPFGGWTPTWRLSEAEHIDACLKFFIDSFEAWRAAMQVESMLLIAHSTGAFVAAHYALARPARSHKAHPTRVERLVLHGPAGLGSWPAPAAAGDETPQAKGVLARGVFAALWGSGVLNFGAIQRLGRIAKEPGRKRFYGFVKRRAGLEDEQERRLFFEYFWTALCAQPISSDKWVNAFLVPVSSAEHPGLYGRRPLADEPAARLASLPPCTVIFGDLDWVMTQSALDAAPALPGGRLHVVKGGFHHLYFDMPEKFHAMVAEALA